LDSPIFHLEPLAVAQGIEAVLRNGSLGAMSELSTKKQSSVTLVGAVFLALLGGEPATATPCTAAPLFEKVNNYNTTIAASGDQADIYFPTPSEKKISTEKFPIALLLPGALVDKSNYSSFASTVARYGFVVVVPNHMRSLPALGFKGLLAETSQIKDVLAHMVTENSNPTSPVAGVLDTQKLVLLGHSHGGVVGISAIENSCIFPFCEGEFKRPAELVAGAFYGTHRQDPKTRKFSATNNAGIPIALVQGHLDGVATPQEAQGTYELIKEPPKALITIDGANHFSITNINNPPGAKPDPSRPTLEQDRGIETSARWSALFLRAHALNDGCAFDYIHRREDAVDANVSVISQTKALMRIGKGELVK
jgi:dienelactone hydrolase